MSRGKGSGGTSVEPGGPGGKALAFSGVEAVT